MPRRLDIQNRHAVDGRRLVRLRRRVGDVVRADDEGDVGGFEFTVDFVQFKDFVIGHVGFRQQDVHVTRHPARDRVDGIGYFDAFGFQQVGHFAQGMLCLGDGHAVTGDDDDLVRIGHDEGRVFRPAGFHRTVVVAAAGRRHRFPAKAAEDDVDDGPVHALAHDVAEDRPRRADQRPGDDQRRVAQREADACRRPAGIAVQHGHDDRHIRAADGHDQQHADGEAEQDDGPEDPRFLRNAEADDEGYQRQTQQGVQRMLPREGQRLGPDQALQLAEGDDRPGEGHGTDGRAQAHFDQGARVDFARRADVIRLRRIEGGARDEDRRQADKAVERGDELRQGRHLDLARDDRPDGAADDDAQDDPFVGKHIRHGQRRDDGDRHAHDAETVAVPCGFRVTEAPQCEDEAYRRDEVCVTGPIHCYVSLPVS